MACMSTRFIVYCPSNSPNTVQEKSCSFCTFVNPERLLGFWILGMEE